MRLPDLVISRVMSDLYQFKSVVWVLGSGFSRCLGGPLLRDMLSDKLQDEAIARIRRKHGPPDPPFLELVNNVYGCYGTFRNRTGYWEDAEAFLEYVETAAALNDPHERIYGYFGGSLEQVTKCCLKIIAAECAFVPDKVNKKLERWAPYVTWAKDLRPADRVITFNYDLVLEALGISLAMPNEPERGCAYKLHGSIDWRRLGRQFERVNCWQAIDHADAIEPFIATPGPGKRTRSQDLETLWLKAKEALTHADVIVFMGYRFPASDAHARSELLGAIRANENEHLRIHTVLGPRTHDDDTVRLLKLLEHTMRSGKRVTMVEHDEMATDQNQLALGVPGVKTYAIIPQPLYVEDFLTVIHDQELYGY